MIIDPGGATAVSEFSAAGGTWLGLWPDRDDLLGTHRLLKSWTLIPFGRTF